ncbi:uncharacterized protein TNIN_191681 [Trichonephila inaurata madagascariensis]|uniref:Uncharacterized protein n=1 Tax=Trichonephila inaurata madagascariensis TaxID=2747483 RepID=A0A8X6IWJ3_9ARAC|nr:uncharacterized protein TNIN_191681 [Trichonephila inaurata madagascariensis]
MWFKILLPHQHYPLLAAMVGKDGKLYFRLVDVGALLGRSKVYEFSKRFDNLVIQGKDVLPAHKRYPVMTQRSKLVTPDVVFNIFECQTVVVGYEFCHQSQCGLCSGGRWSRQPVCESYKTSPSCMFKILPTPIQSW